MSFDEKNSTSTLYSFAYLICVRAAVIGVAAAGRIFCPSKISALIKEDLPALTRPMIPIFIKRASSLIASISSCIFVEVLSPYSARKNSDLSFSLSWYLTTIFSTFSNLSKHSCIVSP